MSEKSTIGEIKLELGKAGIHVTAVEPIYRGHLNEKWRGVLIKGRGRGIFHAKAAAALAEGIGAGNLFPEENC